MFSFQLTPTPSNPQIGSESNCNIHLKGAHGTDPQQAGSQSKCSCPQTGSQASDVCEESGSDTDDHLHVVITESSPTPNSPCYTYCIRDIKRKLRSKRGIVRSLAWQVTATCVKLTLCVEVLPNSLSHFVMFIHTV